MRFVLFGGADCGDLLLAQLAALAAMSPPQAEALVSFAVEALATRRRHDTAGAGNAATAAATAAATVTAAATSSATALRDALLQSDEFTGVDAFSVAHAACAVHTVAENIVRYAVEAEVAERELSMLGLERFVAEAVLREVAARRPELTAAAASCSPRQRPCGGVTATTATTAAAWAASTGEVEVHLDLGLTAGPVALSAAKAQALLAELSAARDALR